MKQRPLWLLAAALLLAGCVQERDEGGGATSIARGEAPGAPARAAKPAAKKGPNDRLKIAVVPKGTTHQFWKTVHAGAEAAGQEFNAEILWNGPKAETDIQDQIDIITSYTGQADGIALAATDKQALAKTVEQLMDGGTPVVVIDSGIEPQVSHSFIATDNVAAAKLAAQELARRLNRQGKVAILSFMKGAGTSDQREQGFLEGLKEFPAMQVVATEETKSDSAQARDKMETLLTAHPDLAGVFASNEPNVVGAAPVLEERKMIGRVKLVGFDASLPEIDYLKKGVVQALVVQDPFRMGYEGVKAIANIVRGVEWPAERIDTGARVVTAENLNAPDIQKLLFPLKQ